ncbi:MAG: rhomboid family intramembrane serine protease [Methylobacteriaceae bacterium]|nr:rhomboid family intramembrane serine protease [Methylobacteriaceae bacterium]
MTFPSVPRRPPRAPIFNVPPIILVIVVVLAAIHVGRLALSEESDLWVLRQLAFVPARLWALVDPGIIARQLAALSADPRTSEQAEIARFFLHGGPKPWSILSYSLLHAGFAHLAVNMLWLVAFGAPVARRFGSLRFLAFLAVAAIAGAGAHAIAHPQAFEPIIGASAAVAGTVAAAVRFVFQPGESLGLRRDEGELLGARAPIPPLPLTKLFRDRQVVGFLGVWFILNFFVGILAVPLGVTEQAIAWEAHIGGFLAGLLLFSAFDPSPAKVVG